ncbi:MAG TPA: hypothetical protein GXX42_10490 [Petrimonas sp.]|uniref:hypothetical protein n=1 Tax=Petrimonas sp. TaxID=2023866 RepID=UPI00095A6235|nr:MAG: hypothetical protein BGO33_14660 [Bacteroidia bacterium 43-41]HHV86220.1 hypothetical protein [Petrimonas sp.]
MHNSKETIYQISGILILISAVLYLFAPSVAPWIMAVSVLAFSAVTALSPYPGKSIRGKRLFNFQVVSCVLMIVATYLMFRNNNLWALLMIIGAVFLLYSGIMIPRELNKERAMGE